MEAPRRDRNLLWVPVESRKDRNYKLFSVHLNKNKSPRTGKIHEFQVLNSPDWVAIIPVTPNNELVMVKQYRH
jgi:ADP-ribose pyrophosphatase